MEVVVSKCKEVSRSDQLGGIASRDERRVSIVDGPSAPPRCAWCADRSRLVRIRVRVGVRGRVGVRVRDRVGDRVEDEVRDRLGARVRARVRVRG